MLAWWHQAEAATAAAHGGLAEGRAVVPSLQKATVASEQLSTLITSERLPISMAVVVASSYPRKPL